MLFKIKYLLILVPLHLFSFSAQALQLRYVGETSIPSEVKFENTTIGGLSALVWANDSLYALSDDKGKIGEPRFYEFELKIQKNKIILNPKAVKFIRGLPKVGDKPTVLDPEGLVRLPDGDFLISSEGDNNSKPREMPRIFRINSEGLWEGDLPLSDKFLPETTGQQKKGTQGNLAFEGLSEFSQGKTVFTCTEAALTQDFIPAEEEKGDWIRIIKYEDKKQKGYQPQAEYAYQVDSFRDIQKGKEVMRGVSEILSVSNTQLLVLERGVRLFSKNIWGQTVGIYLADLSKATDVSSLNKLTEGKFLGVDKVKLIDFETDLLKERGDKKIQNFEGMAWGPRLEDGRRSLLLLVDNNFSKNELTELVVFAVEGE
jgi:hypothetical protein